MNRKDISYVFRKWLLADKVRFKFSAYIYIYIQKHYLRNPYRFRILDGIYLWRE